MDQLAGARLRYLWYQQQRRRGAGADRETAAGSGRDGCADAGDGRFGNDRDLAEAKYPSGQLCHRQRVQ
ncbi:hypothetical protein D3C73_1594540 [compost metagenome]